MIIDLTKVPIGISETERELLVLKSAKLVNELVNLNTSRKYKLNCIIVPPSILNIIEQHQNFYSYILDNEIESPFYVGSIVGYSCYVDLHIPSNVIKVNCDTQLTREIKLESIFDNKQTENYDYEIEVIF